MNNLLILRALFYRECVLTWRNRLGVLMALLFFVAAASLFAFSVEPNPNLLRKMAVAVILSTALLANLLTLERLFVADYHDGTLVQLMLLPIPLSAVVAVKICIHYLSTGIALALIAPLIAVQYQMTMSETLPIIGAILLIMPSLSAIGALSNALTLGLDAGNLLPALLYLPLCVPILIFAGIALGERAMMDNGAWFILGAILLISVFFLPMLTASALKWIIE